ncbi:MAG: MFS transporter [Chloroflexi bacterium]|nr:MFS transporter [Chloroflexota bacterium]
MRKFDKHGLLIRPKAFYFFYYAALAAISPYLALYYRSVGLGGREIGILSALPPLVTMICGPLWSAAADQHGAHRVILMLTSVGALVFGYILSRVGSLPTLTAIVILYAIFRSPIVALADSSVLKLLGAHKERYGSQRLWGAIGWGLAAPLVGELTEHLGMQYAFNTYAMLSVGSLICALLLPTGQPSERTAIFHGIKHLFRQSTWIVFLVTMFLAGMGAAVNSNYLFLRMEDQGASRSLMGIALTVSSVSEIIVFTFVGRALQRWGAYRLLLAALAASSIRLFLYSIVQSPILVLPVQLFHGLAFSLLWSAGVSFADSLAPSGLSATAQAVFGAVEAGLATACGSLLAGLVYDSAGSTAAFRLASLLVAVGFVIFLVFSVTVRKTGSVNDSLTSR